MKVSTLKLILHFGELKISKPPVDIIWSNLFKSHLAHFTAASYPQQIINSNTSMTTMYITVMYYCILLSYNQHTTYLSHSAKNGSACYCTAVISLMWIFNVAQSHV